MDVRTRLLSRRAGWLEVGTVVVACGLPVVMLSAGESTGVTAALSLAVAGIASAIGLVLMQIRIGLFHVESGAVAAVVLLVAGIATWSIAVLLAASERPAFSLSLTAVSAVLLLFAVRQIAWRGGRLRGEYLQLQIGPPQEHRQ